jgi:hypothetical protein
MISWDISVNRPPLSAIKPFTAAAFGAALFDLTLRPAACRSMQDLEEAASRSNAGLLTIIGF